MNEKYKKPESKPLKTLFKMGNISLVQCIQLDQNILEPINVTPAPCLFTKNQNNVERITATYYHLMRARRRGDRIESLAYAYYLGSILDVMSESQRRSIQGIVSHYYSGTALRIYYIFERYGVEQVYRTTYTSLARVHRLTDAKYRSLLW